MRRLHALFLLAALGITAGLVVPGTATAGPPVLPKTTPAAGWETPAFAANYSQIGERFSSPAVGDLDGNGVPDVVAGFPDGHIRAWRTDNGALWLDHWTGAGAVQASPLLVDYDGNGRPDIVFANTHGDIGVLTWDKRTIFYAKIGDAGGWSGALATPAVADINHDGRLDVVVSGFDQHLHAWGPGTNPPELPGFPVHLQDTSWSSPAVGDLNGDGWADIVVGWDCDGAPGQACAPGYGGYVGAFDHNGRELPGWPRFVAGQVVWSSPALGDLDGDGRLDVVVGTGNMNATMFDGGRQPMRGTQVFGFRADGSNLPGWPVNVGRNVTSSPALGDVNGDGRTDVAFVAEDGFLYAYSGSGGRLFARCAGNDVSLPPNDGSVTYGRECPMLHASPSIADVLGTGRQQVLVGGEQWMHVFDAAGNVVSQGETFANTDPMTATPTVASVGGRTWIVEATTTGAGGLHGRVFAWAAGSAGGRADWPTFKGSSARSGSVPVAPVQVRAIGAIGDKYAALGGAATLGAPLANEYGVPGGRAQDFARGRIYWSGGTGAHEVHGLILDRYLRLGGPGGRLGLPVSDELGVPGGRASDFQVGTVYWSGGTGAWSVQGLIRERYRALGGPGGSLSFPTTDEYDVPGGKAGNFLGGIVYWSPASGAHAAQNQILYTYARLGGPGGRLGFPVADETGTPGGRVSDFQIGSIYFSAPSGAFSVQGMIRAKYRSMGGTGSSLGFPRGDEYAVPGGARSDFVAGSLRWDAANGQVS